MFEGEISISFISSERVEIRIDDAKSGRETVHVEIDAKSLALAFMQRGNMMCVYSVHPRYCGATYEQKSVTVTLEKSLASPQEVVNFLRTFEVDGWRAPQSSFRRNLTGRYGYAGTFPLELYRYLDKDGKPIESGDDE